MSDTYLMIDRAQYDPRLIATAQSMGAKAIGGYAFDHYLLDINGYCGGWTPDAIAAIYAAGLDYHPIFVMRDGETPLDPSVCVDILHKLGVRAGAWTHVDVEGGAMVSLAWVANFNAAVKQAGFRAATYGTQSTLDSGYLANADAPWVAMYLGLPWDSALQATLANMPNVGVWQYAAWQYANSQIINGIDVDVSISNLPIASGAVLAATGGLEVLDPNDPTVVRLLQAISELQTDVRAVTPQVQAIYNVLETGGTGDPNHPNSFLGDFYNQVKAELDAIKSAQGAAPRNVTLTGTLS